MELEFEAGFRPGEAIFLLDKVVVERDYSIVSEVV